MSAPERIWLNTASQADNWTGSIGEALLEETCYLRFDTVEARLAAAEAMAEALREARGGLEWAQAHLMESAGMSSVPVDTASDSVSAALAQWDAVKGGEG